MLGIALIVTLATAALAFGESTTYTGRAALTIGSPNRAPEQDGVLASGYVDYFSSGGYQDKLKASGDLPADVTLSAGTAAASPIIYIDATADSRETAVAAAAKAAQIFHDDINAQLRAAQDETIAAVRKPLDDVLDRNGVVGEVARDQIQDRINQINADTSNKLLNLQSDSGVTENSPDRILDIVFALVGGLLLGGVIAICLGAFSRRFRSAGEVAAKTGTRPLVEIPADGDSARQLRVQQLVNVVAEAGLPAPATVTVTSTVASAGTREIARAIAEGRAVQGLATVLIDADLSSSSGFGLADVLTGNDVELADILNQSPMPKLRTISAGSADTDPFALLSRERVGALIGRLHEVSELVVLAAPPITTAAEAQVLCAAADAVLLVIDKPAARVADVRESLELLAHVDGRLLGTVLIDPAVRVDKPAQVSTAKHVAAEADSVAAGDSDTTADTAVRPTSDTADEAESDSATSSAGARE
ncbi:hypothetical protein [Antrihabitans sp. YC2-6]|uniref:hypothetical protein n=1 Tax=Antrihabitans sp. YC2-6 TaxID=2799498 RepID=UPI0018F582A6|nr:hypothetical protein [Antrihabitans sp. YC2-6]MBJ8344003.1 hypothetical protein [Antrihabitans sp. YC2-6]